MSDCLQICALLLVGSAAGAWVSATACGCLGRWRWRRRWRRIEQASARDFHEVSLNAHLLAELSQRRMQEHARRLKEASK